MRKINVLVVDDEPLAREGLVLRLEKEPDMHVLAECGSGREAIRLIYELKPDLVFLDINMPKISGFDVIDEITVENMPAVIFLTAYDEFAIKAFRVNALDYLLKPINNELFCESLQRARQKIRNESIEEHSQHLRDLLNSVHHVQNTPATSSQENERIVVRSNGHVYFLKSEDILWVEADGDYINIHTHSKKHMIRETLRNMEQKLVIHGFQRIHRSAIVRLSYIQELLCLDTGEYEVILECGKALKLSRSYRDALFLKLKTS